MINMKTRMRIFQRYISLLTEVVTVVEMREISLHNNVTRTGLRINGSSIKKEKKKKKEQAHVQAEDKSKSE